MALASPVVVTYCLYLAISICLTIWVARTLFHNGRIFLVDVFHGNESLADSVNHLLVVGFYLINFGYVTLALKLGYDVTERPRLDRGAVAEGRLGAPGARRHALLQPLRLQPHPPPRRAGDRAAAGRARRLRDGEPLAPAEDGTMRPHRPLLYFLFAPLAALPVFMADALLQALLSRRSGTPPSTCGGRARMPVSPRSSGPTYSCSSWGCRRFPFSVRGSASTAALWTSPALFWAASSSCSGGWGVRK